MSISKTANPILASNKSNSLNIMLFSSIHIMFKYLAKLDSATNHEYIYNFPNSWFAITSKKFKLTIFLTKFMHNVNYSVLKDFCKFHADSP